METKQVSMKTMTYTFKASSCNKYGAWKTIDGPMKTLVYLQSSRRGMHLVFNHSFYQREKKIGTVNANVAYNCLCKILICIQRLLVDAAVSEILAAAYDCLLNPKLAHQRGNCAGQSDHNFAYTV